MSTRYITNATTALLGGVVVVLSMGLSSTTAIGWVAFALAIGVVAISVFAQLDRRRGLTQRALDMTMILVAGTLIGVSVFFTGTTVMWLALALGLAVVTVAFAGLTAHEIETWRSSHQLGQLHWLVPGKAGRREEAGPRAA